MRSVVRIAELGQVPVWFSHQLREDDEEGMRAAPSNSSAHSQKKSHEQVGLWDSSAFLPATEKQAGPLNFMEDHWRKREEAQCNPAYEVKSIQDEKCGTESNHCL